MNVNGPASNQQQMSTSTPTPSNEGLQPSGSGGQILLPTSCDKSGLDEGPRHGIQPSPTE
eukprot:3078194-Alexandrium_andersonii.AAC.1